MTRFMRGQADFRKMRKEGIQFESFTQELKLASELRWVV